MLNAKQLVQAGVWVFFYLEDRERTLDTPTDKIMMVVDGLRRRTGAREGPPADGGCHDPEGAGGSCDGWA